MANAKHDANSKTTLIIESSDNDGVIVAGWADPTTHRILVDAGSITATVSGSDGAIQDGASTAIKATVLDYASSNPLAVRLTDTNGDYIAAGAGTQYTEDAAAAANPIGGAIIVVRDDARGGSLVTTDGDNVAVRGTNAGEIYVKHVDSIAITGTVTGITDTVEVNAAQKGTWTVQPGNTPNTTPWLVTQIPATSGGLSTYRVISAGSTADALIKSSAGQVFSWVITNVHASARVVKLYNSTSTPTSGGTTPLITLVIPGNSSANSQGGGETFSSTNGIAFSNGIGIGIVTGVTDSATGSPASGDIVANIFYK